MTRRERPRSWLLALGASLVFGALFAIFGGLRTGYDAKAVPFFAMSGATIGAMMAPQLEPTWFRHPLLWQVTCGALGGLALAVALEAGAQGALSGAIIGAVLGLFAPVWVKHVQLP